MRHWFSLLLAIMLSGLALPSFANLTQQWQRFAPGPNNDITDVAGIGVAHFTVHDAPHTATGATVIMPRLEHLPKSSTWASAELNLANAGLLAGAAVLNGNGEMTGLHYLNSVGVLGSPIVLTSTAHVGQATMAVQQWMAKTYKTPWMVGLPVVAECWDGALNRHPANWRPEQLFAALDEATETKDHTPVRQGRVGAGTGMRSFGLFGGIGSASRQIELNGQKYTVGVMVNMNHSRPDQLAPTFAEALTEQIGSLGVARSRVEAAVKQAKSSVVQPRQGSIIVIIATDAPLLPNQLQELARHAGLGIAAMGSRMNTTSGDFALAFSTAQVVPLANDTAWMLLSVALGAQDDLIEATIEAVVAAQYNALVASNRDDDRD